MFKEVVKDIIARRSNPESEEVILPFTERRATVKPEDFIRIEPLAFAGKACFIDGGNASVFEAPNVRIEFVRIVACIYEGERRADVKNEEGLLLIRNDTGTIRIDGYAPFDIHLILKDDDKELRLGRERVTLATAANLARSLLEVRFAQRHAHRCGLLVRDGALLGANRHEEEAFKALIGLGIPILGVSKTNTLLTIGGGSAAASLLGRGPAGSWYCRLD
jgi:hypothetical protein